MRVVHDAADLVATYGCVVVPTMGALHAGHGALISRARRVAAEAGGGPVVVTVFVNPTQFGDASDLARYPRTLGEDVILSHRAGADVVFAPPVGVVYPAGAPVPAPALPAVADGPGLEDARRPGHFAGVCQVVRRLFELVRPSAAVFGEKDWQQLQVIRAMTAEQGLGVRIVDAPTVREAGDLAMSSRNRFLSASDRRRGLAISASLRAAGVEPTAAGAEAAMRRVLEAAGIVPDYAVVRDAETLLPVATRAAESSHLPARPCRALVAARVGPVRLIDNAAWPNPRF